MIIPETHTTQRVEKLRAFLLLLISNRDGSATSELQSSLIHSLMDTPRARMTELNAAVIDISRLPSARHIFDRLLFLKYISIVFVF